MLFIAVMAFISGVVMLTWKPQFVIDQIQKYLVKPTPIEQVPLKGIGILGDSQSDEYRADDKRGANYPTSTYSWVEILAQERNLNFGEWNYYEEPRRQGFKYNFARSGATAQTMIDQGQHTGLAQYVQSGEVTTVIIYIGANDFAPYLYDNAYSAIYHNEISRSEIIEKENNIVANIDTAIDTLQEAGSPKIFIVTIPDWGNHTAVKVGFPLPHQRYRVSTVINETNAKINELAERQNVEIIEINEFYHSLRGNDASYHVRIGDVILEQFLSQNNPRNIFLSDGVHPGTAINGLFANFILNKINPHLANPVDTLTEKEILSVSGLD